MLIKCAVYYRPRVDLEVLLFFVGGGRGAAVVVVGSRCVCRRAGWCDSFAGMR